MSFDITKLLDEWPYEPGQLSVRMITGDDGEPRVQVRVDLGILQMFADGRPDGQKPFGFPSLLEYFEDQIEGDQAASPHATGEPEGDKESAKRQLTTDDCRLLREEAELFYRRYVAMMVLEDFDRVVRDTSRNLRVLDLCRDHAQAEEDRTILEQFRPYIVMVRTRALASQALRDNEPKAAILALDEGLDNLRHYFSEAGRPQGFDKSTEVQILQGMRDQLVPKLPISQKTELRQRLAKAIADENYELAAILRDELKQLKD